VPREILFYSVGDEYGELSNFAPYPIRVDGKRWPTSEHYFQAQKFRDPKLREEVRRRRRQARPHASVAVESDRSARTGSR